MSGADQERAHEAGRREKDEFGAEFLKCFGRQIKLFRERAGLTQAEMGRQLGYGEDQISSLERGRRVPQPDFIDRADELLDAGGVLKAAKPQVARSRYPAWFRDFARLEAQAVELHAYDSLVVNGLLQTEEYARAVFTAHRPPLDEDVIEQRLIARMARQEIFSRRPVPMLSFVVEESVLRRPLGGRDVLRGQLEHLLRVGRMRNVEIQVMPTGCEDHAGLGGPLILLEPSRGSAMAYLEVHNVSTLLTERKEVRANEIRYGIIRALALTPGESSAHIEKLLGET